MKKPGASRAFSFGVLIQQRLRRGQIGPPHRLAVDAVQRRLAQRIQGQQGEVYGHVIGAETVGIEALRVIGGKTQLALDLLERDALLVQEQGQGVGIVAEQVQADGGVLVGRAVEHRADEAWFKALEEL
jgi:hypothetical protein